MDAENYSFLLSMVNTGMLPVLTHKNSFSSWGKKRQKGNVKPDLLPSICGDNSPQMLSVS